MSMIATASSFDNLPTHALPTGKRDHSTSGFTAVNGDSQSSNSLRLDEPRKGLTIDAEQPKYQGTDASSAHFRSHGWRPEGAADLILGEAPEQKKRKRSDSTEVKPMQSTESHDGESPKRRAMDLNAVVSANPSAMAYRAVQPSQGEGHPPDMLATGAFFGERSPAARWSRGQPPPLPRPDIEADLAESLQRELQSAQQDQAGAQFGTHAQVHAKAQAQGRARVQVQAASQANNQVHANNETYAQPITVESSPSVEPYSQQARHSYSPELDPDDPDSKKRKRTFSNRTKTGCHTCRNRKKKCDERKPTCHNCEKGNFPCGGYGPKPAGGFKVNISNTKIPISLQSKPPYDPSQGPTGYYPSPVDEPGRSYSHWGRLPPEPEAHVPTIDPRQHASHASEGWTKSAVWPAEPPPTCMPPRLPPTDMNHLALHGFPPKHQPLPPLDVWTEHGPPQPYRPMAIAGHAANAYASSTTSQQTAVLALNHTAQLTEKQKMLLGRPFLHFIDTQLFTDRQHCKGALERYNDAARSNSHISAEERARFFRAIVNPTARPEHRREEAYTGPQGGVGHETIIESPFTCEYGYNIHIGSEVVMQSDCYMQDACEIRIGNRTIIGPNVKFYGITASKDASARKGSRGPVQGGAIHIGDDCFIGGGVIILPYRTIGNGSVVGAGSVVTKDVKENTVVAGNPAKVISRIEPGPNVDRHRSLDIQEQNEKMLEKMWEIARRATEAAKRATERRG